MSHNCIFVGYFNENKLMLLRQQISRVLSFLGSKLMRTHVRILIDFLVKMYCWWVDGHFVSSADVEGLASGGRELCVLSTLAHHEHTAGPAENFFQEGVWKCQRKTIKMVLSCC